MISSFLNDQSHNNNSVKDDRGHDVVKTIVTPVRCDTNKFLDAFELVETFVF